MWSKEASIDHGQEAFMLINIQESEMRVNLRPCCWWDITLTPSQRQRCVGVRWNAFPLVLPEHWAGRNERTQIQGLYQQWIIHCTYWLIYGHYKSWVHVLIVTFDWCDDLQDGALVIHVFSNWPWLTED